jgi:hypothetical protein
MRITSKQLRQVIREELSRTLLESEFDKENLVKGAAEDAILKSRFDRGDIDSYNELLHVVNSFLEYIEEFMANSDESEWFNFDHADGKAPFWGLELARDVAIYIMGRDLVIEPRYLLLAFEEMKRGLEANPPYDHYQDLDAMELEQTFGPTEYRKEQIRRRGR